MRGLVHIREIDPAFECEVHLVAQRMRQTLVEVLGKERGESMYTMEWLIDRVRWHLDQTKTNGKVFLSENQKQEIVGQAVARIDFASDFGYFSTIFVESKSRKCGVAKALISHVENWFLQNQISKIIYNTAQNHLAIIHLFESQGYLVTHRDSEMIQLTKFFS